MIAGSGTSTIVGAVDVPFLAIKTASRAKLTSVAKPSRKLITRFPGASESIQRPHNLVINPWSQGQREPLEEAADDGGGALQTGEGFWGGVGVQGVGGYPEQQGAQ